MGATKGKRAEPHLAASALGIELVWALMCVSRMRHVHGPAGHVGNHHFTCLFYEMKILHPTSCSCWSPLKMQTDLLHQWFGR